MGPTSTIEQKGLFKVLAGIDFDTAGQGALRRAMALVSGRPCELHLVTVVEPHAVVDLHPRVPTDALERLQTLAEQELATFASAHPESQIQRVVAHLLNGRPAEEIVWLAAKLDIDLIVLGSHGHTGIQRLVLGSVAETVAHAAGCPVLIDRPKHYVHAGDVPEIEPLCPECAERRRETGGDELWCATHTNPHPRRHVYSWADNSRDGFRPWGFSV